MGYFASKRADIMQLKNPNLCEEESPPPILAQLVHVQSFHRCSPEEPQVTGKLFQFEPPWRRADEA
jgi:hypothetical protein